ncbi:nephrocystin-3 [Chenopodium quinoa]|uniref:nephrocystin-3 n=1 Tax=Chenopodium quinoa TaxID=63459 RepID=UPI000B78EC17|nr:nephrocystin-3 [Chenopodium quinoa]
MFGRQITPLLRKLCGASPIASSSCRGLPTASSSSLCHTRNMICYSQNGFEHSKTRSGGFLWMLLHGQAALLFGGSCSLVFAEEVSNGKASETNAGESANVGLQRLEDGSIISNEHTSKWRIFTDNGREFFLQGRMIEAEKLFSSALEEAKKGFGERDPHVASACNNLAELYRVQKSYDKAEPLYIDSISILEEAFGPDDVRVGAALHNLGQFYIVQRKFEEARVCYERSLKIKGRVLGHGHADYAETMFHLGTVLYLQGNAKDAEALIKDSIRILEEGGQGESFSCIRKLRYLAKIFCQKNQLGEAENIQRKILHIMELTKGWDSLDTVNAAESLSMTLQSLGKVRDARELLERCLDVRKTLLPQDHIQIGANLLGLANLALLNFKNNKFATSEANLELDRAKDLLTNSVRIAQLILDGSKAKRNTQNYGQQYGKNEHPALIILLQSLKALAQVEVAKQEEQKTGEALPFLEAEKPLRHCIRAFKQYGAVASTSTPIAVKEEYASCLKNLLSLIIDTPSDTEHSRKAEVQKLKDEIMCIEEEISLHNNKHKL